MWVLEMLPFSIKPGIFFVFFFNSSELNANSTRVLRTIGQPAFTSTPFKGLEDKSDIWTEQRRVAKEPRGGGEARGRTVTATRGHEAKEKERKTSGRPARSREERSETCWGTTRRYKRLKSERRQSSSRRERQERGWSSARRNTMLGGG